MAQQSIEYEVGFADAEFVSYEKDTELFKITIRSWNDRLIELSFSDCVFVADNLIGDISDVVQVCDQTDIVKTALERVYESVPTTHPYKHFRFLNLDGEASLDVVAQQCTVSIKE